MGFEQRKQERQALVQHLLAQDWNVFGTLKFVNGRTIGRETANTLLRSYWNKLDRVIYGKAAERQNLRVPRWCFAHDGADHENGPVAVWCRSKCSFKLLSARRRPGFSSPVLSVSDADYRTR